MGTLTQNKWWKDNVSKDVNTFKGWLGDHNAPSTKLARIMIENCGYKSILDCACGFASQYDGFFEDKYFINYTGIDTTPYLVEIGKGKNVIEGNINLIQMKGSAFDVVYARHILEHLENYTRALKEMYRMAIKEVMVIFFIPPGAEKLGYDSNLENKVYLNTYSKEKIEATIKEMGATFEWVTVGNEVILRIYKQ